MKLLIVCCVLLLCRDCTGFLCRVCSYWYNPNILDNDQKCIYNPTAITGPNSYIRCNRTCIIQENYNHVLGVIESYVRTCNARQERGYCIPDDTYNTCYDSCLGDYCNDDINVPLHELYPVRNWQHPGANHYCNEADINVPLQELYPVQDWQHPDGNYYCNEATTTNNLGLPVKVLVSTAMAYLCVLRVAPVT